VVSRSVLMKQLIIERVREPRERMPVSLLHGGEGPGDRVPGHAVVDVRILGDIAIVVVVDERVAIDRIVERQRDYYEQETKDYVAPFGRREKARWFTTRFSCRSWQQKDLTTEDTEDTGVLPPSHLFCHVTNVTDAPLHF
jgi:hypothetical protein